jgi:hypothetical protein
MKKPDLKLGVIGSGGRGGNLARTAHQPGRGARIVACCDVSPATLERNRTEFGADIFTTHDYQALLERDLDAVIIGTPDFLHEEQALAALRTATPFTSRNPWRSAPRLATGSSPPRRSTTCGSTSATTCATWPLSGK